MKKVPIKKATKAAKKASPHQSQYVRLKDVLFLCHPKPSTPERAALYKSLADGTLKSPDTWEVLLSAGGDKKQVFEQLITEKKLGGLALLRNLRNMVDAKVDHKIVAGALKAVKAGMLLPLNFYGAAKHAPTLSREIEAAMLRCYSTIQKLPGHTVFVVDVSGSMTSKVSAKSEYSRMEVAAALSMLAAEISERVSIYATAGSDARGEHQTVLIPNHFRGFALAKEIQDKARSLGGGGIFTRQCLEFIKADLKGDAKNVDRVIVFSDSQDCDRLDKTPKPFGKNNYIVDVSAHQHGINYKGIWTAEVSGWSENFLNYIAAFEGVYNAQDEQ